MRLENKVAIIIGAGSGIGRETALLFAKEGAKVPIIGRTVEKLEDVYREIDENGRIDWLSFLLCPCRCE
jgi:NAD(P)-dependent dehydrogenase (short-subunit alcohol dehydrogenase family)